MLKQVSDSLTGRKTDTSERRQSRIQEARSFDNAVSPQVITDRANLSQANSRSCLVAAAITFGAHLLMGVLSALLNMGLGVWLSAGSGGIQTFLALQRGIQLVGAVLLTFAIGSLVGRVAPRGDVPGIVVGNVLSLLIWQSVWFLIVGRSLPDSLPGKFYLSVVGWSLVTTAAMTANEIWAARWFARRVTRKSVGMR